MIDLNFNVVDVCQRRSQGKQARECRLINDHGLGENEVVGGLRLNQPALGGRDSVPMFPSGLPVEKKKEDAEAWGASGSKAITVKLKASLAAVAAFVLIKLGFAEVEIRRFTSWIR